MSGLLAKIDKNVRHHSRRSRQTLRGRWWDRVHMPAERPVFIVSGSRSGTQMLYKTISLSGAIASLDREIYAVWDSLQHPRRKGWDTHALSAADASAHDRDVITRYFYTHAGSTHFVDKNNQHGLAVPYLHALFPDARFVYLKRNPGDTLNSMIEGWAMPERFGAWARDLPDEVAVDGGRYTRWCFYLADGWRAYRAAALEEVCAFQYNAIHRAILAAREDVPAAQWTEVFYEDIVRAPAATLEQVFARLDLPFDDAIRAQAASLLERPYDALFEIGLEKWRSHAHHYRIERVLPSVADTARAMGYAI